MAIDFTKDYILQTAKGNIKPVIIHYTSDLSTASSFLNTAYMQYKGNPIGTSTVYSASIYGGSKDRAFFPIMGDIAVLNADGSENEDFLLYAREQSSNLVIGASYKNTQAGINTGVETVTNVVSVGPLIILVDNFDNFKIFSQTFRADVDQVSYTENTENEYGYFEGVLRQLPSISKSPYYTGFSSALEPLLTLPKTDPYAPGGTSGGGGGTGNFDLQSDAVDFPALPTLTAVSTGLVSVYTPTLAQLNALATFLWNANPTDVDWWKKLIANPLDLILGLSIVPCDVPAGAAQNIKVGLIDTGVSVTRAATQFVEVDCGSLNVEEFWGSALDYLPFRKHSIYLPFIGTRSISTDDIMGKTVSVKYHIDLLSGACTAMVKCGDAVLYQYSGACAVSIPLTGQTFTNMITSTIQLAAGVAATVASGGAAAGVTVASAANSVMSMKPIVERAGGVSGAAGQLGVMTPYLIGEIPRQSVPENYNQFAGYPSNITSLLADLSGYTEVEKVFLQNIPATSEELEEIERLLKEGVIL